MPENRYHQQLELPPTTQCVEPALYPQSLIAQTEYHKPYIRFLVPNGTMMLVRPGRGLDYRFLAHVLGGTTFQKLIADKTSGSSIPHLFQRDIVGLQVRLPPLEEQRRIAEILDTIDETIQATERVIAKLEIVRMGLIEAVIPKTPLTALDGVASVTVGFVGPTQMHYTASD